ncbi:MAG: class I SAM-dependent methyltransferase [Anaerolineae bacterium]|jgi:SAM-dependent methyltransferase|nr:class I SAM-dependent methyltransferase [Anaerolineae bacterium]
MYSNDTTDFYDAIAEYYPLFYRDWESQLDREGLSLRAIFRNKGIERVLDASCGAGTQSIALAKLGFQVVAVDPSAGMLKKAQTTAQQYGVSDKIQFERANFLTLHEVVQKPFDAIITKGNALPHLLLDEEIESTLLSFYELLRPGGMLVIGMRDFGPFMEDRPRFLPGFIHEEEHDGEFVTFDLWEWFDGPPVIATRKLFIVRGNDQSGYQAIKRQVRFRPLSTDEVKVVLLEVGFEEINDSPDRTERVLVARKPLGAKA